MKEVNARLFEFLPKPLAGYYGVVEDVARVRRQPQLIFREQCVKPDFSVYDTAYFYPAGIDKQRIIQPCVTSCAQMQHGTHVQVKIGLRYMRKIGLLAVQVFQRGLTAIAGGGLAPLPTVVGYILPVKSICARLEKPLLLQGVKRMHHRLSLIRFDGREDSRQQASAFTFVAIDEMIIVFV